MLMVNQGTIPSSFHTSHEKYPYPEQSRKLVKKYPGIPLSVIIVACNKAMKHVHKDDVPNKTCIFFRDFPSAMDPSTI
jgi:hypothetical protein